MEMFHMKSGDIAIVFPNLIHHYQVFTKGINRAFYIQISPSLCGLFGEKLAKFCPDNPGNETSVTVTVNNGHTGDKEIRGAKDATCTEAGYTGDLYCKSCGVKLSTGSSINKSPHDTVTQKLPPEIIEGAGQRITVGEKKALTFRSNALFDDFKRVELDGDTLDTEYYTAGNVR